MAAFSEVCPYCHERNPRDTYWKRQKCPPPIKDMILPVNLEHYKRKYRALLYYEEKEHVEVLKAK